MFCRSKLLICFHAVAFFSIRVISAMYTNHIDARSINVNSDIGKKFYMTLLFMILIMIVNIWELLKNWIDSRKKEFYIRRIVGADKKQIMILFLLDYIGIMIISAILGIVLSFLFCLLHFRIAKGYGMCIRELWGSLCYLACSDVDGKCDCMEATKC